VYLNCNRPCSKALSCWRGLGEGDIKTFLFSYFFYFKNKKNAKENYFRSPHPNPLQQERALELRLAF
jgi:hypothetical protein